MQREPHRGHERERVRIHPYLTERMLHQSDALAPLATIAVAHRERLATPLLKGLPGDRCSCPHWGYLFKGKITYRFADHDEVFEAGDAFYVPHGHTPIVEEGTEFVQFSPSRELQTVTDVMMKNAQALGMG